METRLPLKTLSIIAVLLCTSFLASAALANKVVDNVKSADQLINLLPDGGHVIYMRHAATDHSQKDTDRDNLMNCGGQRNLSSEGHEDSAQIAEQFRSLSITLSTVYSSPYCRAKDTAAYFSSSVELDDNLQFSISKNIEESAELGEYLYRKMVAAAPGDANVLIVGHTSNLRDGVGIWPKPEGVMVVFTVQDDHLVYHGQIAPADWKQ